MSTMVKDPTETAIVSAYRSGMSVEDIAARSRCTPMLVRQALGEAGLLSRRRGRKWPYDARVEDQIAAAYADGATMRELVERHGGSNRTIGFVLDHRGVATRARGRRPA